MQIRQRCGFLIKLNDTEPEKSDTGRGLPHPVARVSLVSGQFHEPIGIEVEIARIQRRACAAAATGATEVDQVVNELGEPVGAAPPLDADEAEGRHGPPDAAPAPGEQAGSDYLLSRPEL